MSEGDKTIQKFTPTPKMKQWIAAAFTLGYGAQVTEVSKKAKISRRSWYDWLENEDFVKWWDTMWQKYLICMRWKLDAIGMEKAQKDYNYWLDMMRRVGNLPPENEQPGSLTQVNIEKIINSKTEKYAI